MTIVFPHSLEPTQMARGYFSAVRLAAELELISRVFVRNVWRRPIGWLIFIGHFRERGL